MNNQRILQIKQEREALFIKLYCDTGSYIGHEGKISGGVCKAIDAQEVLDFQSTTIALILEASQLDEQLTK